MDECSAPLHEELQGSSPEEARRINRVHVRDGVKQETTEENTEFKESPGGGFVLSNVNLARRQAGKK